MKWLHKILHPRPRRHHHLGMMIPTSRLIKKESVLGILMRTQSAIGDEAPVNHNRVVYSGPKVPQHLLVFPVSDTGEVPNDAMV